MPNGGNLTISADNVMLDAGSGDSGDGKPRPHVLITVRDTGMGIPQEIRDKIFDPFFTTKEVGKGTGLGLSTTMAIVKSHGGFISVYSETGKGSVFKVYLPAQTTASAAAMRVDDAQLPRGNGETILVVDDEASVRIITKQTLHAFGYNVLTAADGAEAVAVYAQNAKEIAVVLTDMMMPVMDGPAMIHALRRIDPGVKVVAASGLSPESHMAKAPSDTVKAFLPKPYTARTLLKTLSDVLGAGVPGKSRP